MGDLTDFQRGKIAGARMTGNTIAETAQLLGISRSTVSKVMAAHKKDSKDSSTTPKSSRSSSLSEIKTINRINRIDHKTAAGKIRAELNEHLERSVSTKIIRWE